MRLRASLAGSVGETGGAVDPPNVPPTRDWIASSVTRRSLLAGLVGSAAGAGITLAVGPGTSTRPMRPASVAAGEFDSTVAREWFDLAGDCVKGTPGYTPPVASRAFGCLGVALYEAVVPGIATQRSLAGVLPQLNGLPEAATSMEYHWPTVANRVSASVVGSLFPHAPGALQQSIEALDDRWTTAFRAATPRAVFNRSVDRGNAVAGAILDWARNDGGHEGYLRNFPKDYEPRQGPGRWEPTPPGFQKAMQPGWGGNRTLALAAPNEFAPAPPPEFSTEPGSTFMTEAMEVYRTVNGLDADQLAIARFWSDDPGLTATPSGHSVSILTQALRVDDKSLAFASASYARLGIAMSDAFISCWSRSTSSTSFAQSRASGRPSTRNGVTLPGRTRFLSRRHRSPSTPRAIPCSRRRPPSFSRSCSGRGRSSTRRTRLAVWAPGISRLSRRQHRKRRYPGSTEVSTSARRSSRASCKGGTSALVPSPYRWHVSEMRSVVSGPPEAT
jgi:hypothetical protein